MSKRLRRRLRPSCESALRLAEWRLANEQRRLAVERTRLSVPARVRSLTRAERTAVWIVVFALVLAAIELSRRWGDWTLSINVGFLLLALGTAAVVAFVLVPIVFRASRTR